MIKNIKSKITKYLDSTNVVYNSIAKVILDCWNNFETNSIADISIMSHTSLASVNRFCINLGLHGFKELKVLILESKDMFISKNMKYNLSKNSLKQKDSFIKNYSEIKINSIEQLENLYVNGIVENMVQDFIESKNIYIFGFSLAAGILETYSRRFNTVGINTIFMKDPNLMESCIVDMTQDDCCLFVSFSGENKILSDLNETIYNVTKNIKQFSIISFDFKEKFKYTNKIIINTNEYNLWDSFSITTQALMQLLDYVYYELVREDIKKVKNNEI